MSAEERRVRPAAYRKPGPEGVFVAGQTVDSDRRRYRDHLVSTLLVLPHSFHLSVAGEDVTGVSAAIDTISGRPQPLRS